MIKVDETYETELLHKWVYNVYYKILNNCIIMFYYYFSQAKIKYAQLYKT